MAGSHKADKAMDDGKMQHGNAPYLTELRHKEMKKSKTLKLGYEISQKLNYQTHVYSICGMAAKPHKHEPICSRAP